MKFSMNMKINIFLSYKCNKYDSFIKYFDFKLNIEFKIVRCMLKTFIKFIRKKLKK